jgi:Glycosyl transferase family 2
VRIGIVTPAYNVAPFIGETLGSVLSQTHTDWTMVVVDDGSTDDTVSVVGTVLDPRVRLVRQVNAGVSAARNRGTAELPPCDAILFLDADDSLSPFALETLAQALSAAPDAVAAVGSYERGGRVYRPSCDDPLQQLLIRNPFVNGGHVLIRRDAVRSFREDLRFGEDWEFWARLAFETHTSRRFDAAIPRQELAGGMANDTETQPIPAPSCFAIVPVAEPVLYVRERPSGAYHRLSTDPASFARCLDTIHRHPVITAHYRPAERAALRRRADAEADWTIGRELIRHRSYGRGLRYLARSVARVPSPRRALLLAVIAVLPPWWRGPLYPYDKVWQSTVP